MQGDSSGLLFSLACFRFENVEIFPGVSKTHNKRLRQKLLKRQMLEITRKRDREEEEDEEEAVITEKNDDGVGDDDEGGVRL